MKGLSVEEKAKRYDELLLKLQKAKVDDDVCDEMYYCVIDDIVPELKESEDERIRKELIGFLRNIPNSNYTCEEMALWLEEQGEQKPVDKAEPKFNVGDWIIDVQGVSANQIIGYEDDSYYIETSCSKFYLPMKLAEKNYRLWTIKDAKAGDVLATGQGNIFIFKSISDCVVCDYCGLYYGKFMDCSANVNSPKSAPIGFHPATKEQRDLLFKKMKEAGYEWNTDKKELKKIEDEIEIPYGSKDSELQEVTYYIPKGFHAEIDDDKVVIKKGEKPTEWSEKHIADVFEKVGLAKIVREQSNDALTIALQDAMIELSKVTLQPKPTAWSEEDEEILRTIISDGIRGAEFDMLQIDWLKSIKNRYAWKPSDEQMKVLEAMLTVSPQSPTMTSTLIELYEDLKKLK